MLSLTMRLGSVPLYILKYHIPEKYFQLIKPTRNFSFSKISYRSSSYYKKFFNIKYAVGGGIGFAFLINASTMDRFLNYEKCCNFLRMFKAPNLNAAVISDQNKSLVSPRAHFNFLADVVEKTASSVVYIEITARHHVSGKHFPISNGSGFIVKSDGLILTNAHVVNHYGSVIVKLHDGREFHGVVEDLDTESDLATVRIKANNLSELPLGKSSDVRPGEFVIAMGNPLTLSHTITAGVVSSTCRKGKDIGLHKKSDYIQTDAAVNVGNSGGPLVNLDGEVIGINTIKVTEGISLAIPSDCATEFLKKIESNKSSSWNLFQKPANQKQKYLGITMMTLSPLVIKDLKERNPDLFPSVEHGVLVWRVMLGSPSYESGIRPGDVITSVNGNEIHKADEVKKYLKSEDVLHITVLRGHRELKMTVQLIETILP